MTARPNRLVLHALSTFLLAAAAGCGESSSDDSARPLAKPSPQPGNGAFAAPAEGKTGDTANQASRAIAEADIVQLAGGRLFAMSRSGTLSVIDVSKRGQLAMLGQAFLPGEPFEMYLRGSQLVVMTNGAYSVNGQPFAPAQGASIAPRDASAGAGVLVVDVSDPGLMQRSATFSVPGEIADSRIVGDILYLVTYENATCHRCGADPRTTVTSFDLATTTSLRQVDQVVFDAGDATPAWGADAWKRSVSVTNERMYVGGRAGGVNSGAGSTARTEGTIDAVDITDPTGKLRRGAHLTTKGAITSRWQMDEHEGVLRVVSQLGTGYVQNGSGAPELQTFHVWNTASIQPIAKLEIRMPRQEALKTVRFDGTRAYAITFAESDPLFVLDLANESAPKQRGEIQMPGWVFHLEPRGNQLLGLGLDRRDAGGHLNVSLFDVADMDDPHLLERVSFGSAGVTTDAQIVAGELPEDQDRIGKAFRVLGDDLVVIPYSGEAAGGCGATGGAVQLVRWEQTSLTKEAALPVAGNPRRALLNEGELLAVSDSNVTAFDLASRVAPRKTADLVIGTCEARPATQGSTGMPRDAFGGEQPEWRDHSSNPKFGLCSTNGAGTNGRGSAWAALLAGAFALVAARRRRA